MYFIGIWKVGLQLSRSYEGHLVWHLLGFVIIPTAIKPGFYVPWNNVLCNSTHVYRSPQWSIRV